MSCSEPVTARPAHLLPSDLHAVYDACLAPRKALLRQRAHEPLRKLVCYTGSKGIKHMPTQEPYPHPTPYRGPNYQGFVFVLVSSSGKANHVLTISTQTNENFFEQAYITGSWYGDDPSQPKAVEGVITGNGTGISCSWSPPNTAGSTPQHSKNVLAGTLTYNVGKFGAATGLIWPSAYLEGDVTAYDTNGDVISGGPGHVTGTGAKQVLALPSL